MNRDLVSVVVAAYNAEAHISECIESILRQTYTNWELIICDDCSTDRTVEIVEAYQKREPRIKLLQNKENMRAGASRNKCIEISQGKFVMIQDADDVCAEDRMEKLVDRIQKGNMDFVSSGHYLFDDGGEYKTVVGSNEYPKKEDFLFGTPFCHAATLFRKECLEKANGYRVSKETRRGQDYDLFMRLYALEFCGCNIPDVLYGYRVDKNTLSRRKFEYRIDECIIRYKGFKSLGLLPKGMLYVFKPIAAYFIQLIRVNKR